MPHAAGVDDAAGLEAAGVANAAGFEAAGVASDMHAPSEIVAFQYLCGCAALGRASRVCMFGNWGPWPFWFKSIASFMPQAAEPQELTMQLALAPGRR